MSETDLLNTDNPRKEVFFCSRASAENHEALAGTASNYHAFILIEYAAPFPKKIGETSIDRNWLKDIEAFAKTRNAKIILIRNKSTVRDRFKIIFVDALRKRYRIHTATGDSYRFFNFKLFAEEEDDDWKNDPFFIVCTNGKKDKCCAKFGLPVFQQLEKMNAIPVFESSHFGGDRFAGNAVLLPRGIYYGRVQPSQVEGLMESTKAGKIAMENYRGLAVYNFAKQSAEIFLRNYLGVFDLDFPLKFNSSSATDSSQIFEIEHCGRRYVVGMEKIKYMALALLTCTSSKAEPLTKYKLLEIK